jgi:hypothetical protein
MKWYMGVLGQGALTILMVTSAWSLAMPTGLGGDPAHTPRSRSGFLDRLGDRGACHCADRMAGRQAYAEVGGAIMIGADRSSR